MSSPSTKSAKGGNVSRNPYYAKDGMVWKHPIQKHNPGGGKTVTLGFPVCKMHEAVGDDAAKTVAKLMNLGHRATRSKATGATP